MLTKVSRHLYDRYTSHYRRCKPYLSASASAIEQTLPWPYDARFEARRRLTKRYLLGDARADSLSTLDRLTAYCAGYTAELYELYGFADGVDRRGYLAELPRNAAKYVNDEREFLDSKERFYTRMHASGFGDVVPEVYGQIEDGELVSEEYERLQSLLASESRIVVKRPDGSSGKGVYVCERDGSRTVLRGRGTTVHGEELIAELDGYLVTEYCQQADYVHAIYPDAANTVRLVAIDSPEVGTFVAGAVQRVGTERSGAVDNFAQYGLSVAIDDETGTLGRAAQRTPENDLVWHDSHPETGAQIRGVEIPGWHTLEDRILDVTRELSGVTYVGWDLVVTGDGEFRILEGNTHPNPRNVQVHQPLLADERTRQFFEGHGLA